MIEKIGKLLVLKSIISNFQSFQMKDTEKVLKEELSKHFEGQSQRLTMMSKLIIALIKMNTVNYSKLALVLNRTVKVSSNFRRIQRFINEYQFCRQVFIQLVWSLFASRQAWIVLNIDRTNWKFGKANINILMIGISYKGTAIPLIWKLLDKRGNSSKKERIDLLTALQSHLTKDQIDQIHCLVADREFIGNQWIKYLIAQPFHFFIRIKKNAKIYKFQNGKACHASRLFTTDQFKVLRKRRYLYGNQLYVGGQKVNNKEWLILISDVPLKGATQLYGERWGIEVFFGACKTRGFNFEDTHVTNQNRLCNLIFIIAIAFCWALKTGEWLIEKGHQIPIKYIKKRKTKLVSMFRLGLDYLKYRFLNFIASVDDIHVLSCT